jgi:hypothetical protein
MLSWFMHSSTSFTPWSFQAKKKISILDVRCFNFFEDFFSGGVMPDPLTPCGRVTLTQPVEGRGGEIALLLFCCHFAVLLSCHFAIFCCCHFVVVVVVVVVVVLDSLGWRWIALGGVG